MMTDDDLFNAMYHIASHPMQEASSFKNGAKEVALFAMGITTADAYANFGSKYPWSRALQAGRVMQTLYDAPGPIGIAIALATMGDVTLSHYQRANLCEGYRHVMSPYAYRIFNKSATDGIEDSTTRTYHVIKHIVILGHILSILKSTDQSIDLDSVHYSLGWANNALIPMCNEDVDAHPMARAMLRRFIEEVQRLITPEVKDAA